MTNVTNESQKSSLLQFPERTIKDWNLSLAAKEAEKDIKEGTIKIYISGTLVAYPTGIEPEHYELIKDLPKADAGIGCMVEDGTLRKSQEEYAAEYNKLIITHLTSQSTGHDSMPGQK